MAIVCNGFTSSANDTTYVEYEAQVNDMFGFISWSGSITSVTCQEYLNGNYYTSYTLISNSQCVDSRASWALYPGTFYFNYGYVTCDTKFVMTIKTTVGTATFTQEYLLKPDYTDCYWGNNARCWLSSSISTSSVTLYWTGAMPGTNNSIWGYEVYRGKTSNTNVYPTDQDWEYVGYTQTETSMIVSAPPSGTYYLYSVYVWGNAESDNADYQDDRWLDCETYLRYGTACKGPEWCVLDEYYTAGESTTIRWGAGTPGTNNPIKEYDVWCKEYDANDNSVGDWVVAVTKDVNTLEATVSPPNTPGNYHYYWVHAVGQNQSDDDDDYEGCYVDWGLTRVTACTAPSYCRLSATESTGEAVTLSWGAGQSGVENALVGYEVQAAPYDPDGEYPSDELWEYVGETGTDVRTMQVYPPDTPNTYYLFAVRSVGENYYSGDEWCDSENLLQRISDNNTIKYHTGSEWVDCIVYYCTGTEWVKCIPHYCDGTSWIECSST